MLFFCNMNYSSTKTPLCTESTVHRMFKASSGTRGFIGIGGGGSAAGALREHAVPRPLITWGEEKSQRSAQVFFAFSGASGTRVKSSCHFRLEFCAPVFRALTLFIFSYHMLLFFLSMNYHPLQYTHENIVIPLVFISIW